MNFSGGEPFIHKKGQYVGELVQYCKTVLALPSVSIVSNGSLITEDWFQTYGKSSFCMTAIVRVLIVIVSLAPYPI